MPALRGRAEPRARHPPPSLLRALLGTRPRARSLTLARARSVCCEDVDRGAPLGVAGGPGQARHRPRRADAHAVPRALARVARRGKSGGEARQSERGGNARPKREKKREKKREEEEDMRRREHKESARAEGRSRSIKRAKRPGRQRVLCIRSPRAGVYRSVIRDRRRLYPVLNHLLKECQRAK